MAENTLEFEKSQEQLQLAALINRFCDRKAEEFDPNVHVDEARKIVKILDPKIKLLSSRFWAEIGASSDRSTNSEIVGATDLGEVKASMSSGRSKEIKTKRFLKEEEKYRIGCLRGNKIKSAWGLLCAKF